MPAWSRPHEHRRATLWRWVVFSRCWWLGVGVLGDRRRRAPDHGAAGHAGHVGHARVSRPPSVAKPRIAWDPIPFGRRRKAEMTAYVRRHYGSFMAPTWRLDPSPRDRDPLHRQLLQLGLQHVRRRRAGLRAARAARHLRALRDRQRRHDPPARLAGHDVPPHRGAELDRDRDRARGLQRRPGARRPAPDHGQPAARALAALPLRDPGPQRDRTQREPVEPLSPRGRGGAAHPDPRRLQPPRHADLPRTGCGHWAAARA